MSLDGLRVNHAGLDAAAANMYTTVTKLDDTLNNLENDIRKDVESWGQESAQFQSYQSAKAAWDWAMKEMRDLLDESHRTVYQSNAEYMGADKRGAARFDI